MSNSRRAGGTKRKRREKKLSEEKKNPDSVPSIEPGTTQKKDPT
jgi:hypothetical protein